MPETIMTDNQQLEAPEPATVRPQPQREPSDMSSSQRTETTANLSRMQTTWPGEEPDTYPFSDMPRIESKDALINRSGPEYRLYKRRWLGLAELTLLNFTLGWGDAAPAVVSTTATEWYNISYGELNWLSIASYLVFLIPAPFTIWILNRYGPKASILIACAFTVVGNWVIYAGANTHTFPVNVLGTVISALSQPFILAAPTRYSRQWFDDSGRTLATAIMSLAYPLGSAVGSLSGPYMVHPEGPLNYSQQSLIIALVFTLAAIPSPFLPKSPPKPPSAVAAVKRLNVKASVKSLAHNPTFYLQFISFSVFAGALNSLTSVTNQAIVPYHFPQVDAGYAIAFLLFTGIIASLVVSPILDKTKGHLIASKIIVLIIAGSYTALPFIPQTHSAAGLYVVYAMIGASSLSVEPCVLEFQAAWTHPVSPEFSSVICWTGAKIMSAVFTILVGNILPLGRQGEGQPAGSLFNGLIFVAAMCWVAVPCALLTGWGRFARSKESVVEGND